MSNISASLVKELREKTGAGMMDCKKALTESAGNFEEAVDWLRTKGLAAAAKKAGRVAAEGLVGIFVDGLKGAIVELNSETDFVARNETFQNLVRKITSLALHSSDLANLEKLNYSDDETVAQVVQNHVAIIGENMSLRRMDNISVSSGVVGSYIHNDVCPGLGKIGVLVAIESSGNQERLALLAKQLSMHIAASKPMFLSIDEVDSESLNKERYIFFEQARASGKPDSIIEKMVDGRIRKYYEEVVLLEQVFVIDGKTKISDLLSEVSRELGVPVELKKFIRYSLGEGIEQEVKNFSDEVNAIAGSKL